MLFRSETLDDVLDVMGWMLTEEHDRKTFILDSVDGLEPLVWAHTCRLNGWANIEDAGFGPVHGLRRQVIEALGGDAFGEFQCYWHVSSFFEVLMVQGLYSCRAPGVIDEFRCNQALNAEDGGVRGGG